jgi:hypothetical protein
LGVALFSIASRLTAPIPAALPSAGKPLPQNQRPKSSEDFAMIRKLKSGQFRLYSRKKDPSTGKRRNLGTFETMDKAKQHERDVQYFKRH